MPVCVGSRLITLRLFGCRSLKEKRFVVKSLKDRIFHRFKVSIAEIDDFDLWQKASIGIAMISSSKVMIERTFTKIDTFIENDGRVEIIDVYTEID